MSVMYVRNGRTKHHERQNQEQAGPPDHAGTIYGSGTTASGFGQWTEG